MARHPSELVKDLRARAEQLSNLTKMPDRATVDDLRFASVLMTRAANDLERLIRTRPPGCHCSHVETENYDYLDYARDCLHHGELHLVRERLKQDYARAEKTLKNKTRMHLVVAALSESASTPEQAIMITDEALRRLGEER